MNLPGAGQYRSLLPVEFVGRARDLRRQLIVASKAARMAIADCLAPLQAQLERRGTMRVESVTGFARAWRLQMPPANQVSLSIETRGGKASIRHVCFLASELSKPSWGDSWEQAIVLTALAVTISRRKVETAERDLAAFNLHCLARRYQRGIVDGKAVLSCRTYFDAAAVPDDRLIPRELAAEARAA